MTKIKLVATDLDGTFLNNDKTIPERNREALEILGKNKVIRVIATGRNLRKVREVIPDTVPFDYIIFSSGAGIYDWQRNRHIYKLNIPATISQQLASYLIAKDLDFNAFRAVPDNHFLWYHRGSGASGEFERYLTFHQSYASVMPDVDNLEKNLCQFLVILPENPELFIFLKNDIEEKFPEIGVIRSTSPLGTGFIWMEIFNKKVSKGNALSVLCKRHGLSRDEIVGIGNDYNDMELLKFTNHSFLVSNSPAELKQHFRAAPSNEESAFSYAVSLFFKH